MADTMDGDLVARRKQFWDENGFLILRGVLETEECDEISDIVSSEWSSREGNDHVIDLSSGPFAHQWFRLNDAPPHSRDEVYKLNNLFARRDRIRELALKPALKSVLAELLEGDPIICNSLNFERGSQQPYHLDTWFMPPPEQDRMVAVNIALEDVDCQNGPLKFYPASQLIPYFAFSDGSTAYVADEVGECSAYLEGEVLKRELRQEVFTCKAGDVLIWHARLYHGGMPIEDLSRTRKSMVIHYWRTCDMAEGVRVDAAGSYLGRTLRGEIAF